LEPGCHPDLSQRTPAFNAAIAPLQMAPREHSAAVEEAEAGILREYKTAIAGAKAVRTHRFYWHSDLSRLMARTGFEHDSSMILPYQPHLTGFKVGRLKRWPVWASDHLHLARQYPCNKLEMPNWSTPGLKIFCFHVAYLYLNANNLGDFNMIREGLAGEEAPKNSGKPGVWDLFELLAGEIARKGTGWFLGELE
jgi:hypothetical protein